MRAAKRFHTFAVLLGKRSAGIGSQIVLGGPRIAANSVGRTGESVFMRHTSFDVSTREFATSSGCWDKRKKGKDGECNLDSAYRCVE